MSTSVFVWIIQTDRPWKPAESFSAFLKTTKSGATWALPDRLQGRRYKVGATAFLTPEAAEMRRQGLCAANLQPARARMFEHKHLHEIVDASRKSQPPKVFVRQLPSK